MARVYGRELMMYKLTVTIYSTLWTWPPAAFVNRGFWIYHWNQMWRNAPAVGTFILWERWVITKENKFTNKQHEHCFVQCRWLWMVKWFLLARAKITNRRADRMYSETLTDSILPLRLLIFPASVVPIEVVYHSFF